MLHGRYMFKTEQACCTSIKLCKDKTQQCLEQNVPIPEVMAYVLTCSVQSCLNKWNPWFRGRLSVGYWYGTAWEHVYIVRCPQSDRQLNWPALMFCQAEWCLGSCPSSTQSVNVILFLYLTLCIDIQNGKHFSKQYNHRIIAFGVACSVYSFSVWNAKFNSVPRNQFRIHFSRHSPCPERFCFSLFAWQGNWHLHWLWLACRALPLEVLSQLWHSQLIKLSVFINFNLRNAIHRGTLVFILKMSVWRKLSTIW